MLSLAILVSVIVVVQPRSGLVRLSFHFIGALISDVILPCVCTEHISALKCVYEEKHS